METLDPVKIRNEDDYRYITLIYHKEIEPNIGIGMIVELEKQHLEHTLWNVVEGFIDIEKDEIMQAINRKLNDDNGKCIIANAIFTKEKPRKNIFLTKNEEVEKNIENSKEFKDEDAKGPRGAEERRKQIYDIKRRMTNFEKII